MATEKEKEDNAKEREKIDVTNNKKEEPVIETKEDEIEDKEEAAEKEEKVEASDDKVEELEEQLEDKTLTAKERERLEKRIQKEREKGKALRDENEDLKRQLAAKPDSEKALTEEDVERLAEQRAEQKVAVREFNASVNRIAESCKKIDKEFSEKVTAMVEDVSGTGSALPSVMVGILDDMPENGGPVLMHLANNVELYEELYQLNPVRMALKLKEISDSVIAKAKKEKTKEISKVPEAKETLKGKGTTPEQRASEKDDMDTFVRKRAREVEERQKARMH